MKGSLCIVRAHCPKGQYRHKALLRNAAANRPVFQGIPNSGICYTTYLHTSKSQKGAGSAPS